MEEVNLAASKLEEEGVLKTVKEDNLDLWDQLAYYDPAVHSPISELSDVLDDDGYTTSPNAGDVSDMFFDDFLDIDKLIATYDSTSLDKDKPIEMQSQLPYTSDVYELNGVADEKMIAEGLQLTEEEKELTEFIISSFDNDSTEMIDDFLTGLEHEGNPSEINLEELQQTASFSHVNEGTDLDELLTENNINVSEETLNTSKCTENIIVNEGKELLNTSELFNTHGDLHKNSSANTTEEILSEIVKCLNSYEDALENCVIPHENSLESLVTQANTVNKDFLVYGEITNEQTHLCSKKTLKRKHASMGDLPSKKSNSGTTRSHSASVGSQDIDLDNTNIKHIRRYKNNEASKITRAKRKSKHDDLFRKERELLKSNAMLRTEMELMQKEVDIIRELLVVALRDK